MKVFVAKNKKKSVSKSLKCRSMDFCFDFQVTDRRRYFSCNGTVSGKRVSVSSGPRKEECLLFP